MTETLEPTSEVIPPDKMEGSRDAYDAIMAKQGTAQPENPALIEEPSDKPPEKKPEPAKAEKAGEGKIPDSLITGEPDRKDTDPNEELEKLFTEEPKGQLKHEHYKKVQQGAKAAVDRANAELATLKAELSKHNGNGKLPEHVEKELADIRAAKTELETELKRVAYERSPEFREKYLSREKSIKDQLTTIGKELGIEQGTVEGALAMTYKRRAEAVDGLDIPESAKGDLLAVMREHDRIQGDKKEALEKSGEFFESQERTRAEQAKAQQERIRKEDDAIFEEVLKGASDKYLAFKTVEGKEDWNKQAEALKAEAKLYWNGQVTPQQAAEVTLAGLALRPTMEILRLTQERLKSANEEIRALKSSNPGGGGAAPGVKVDESGITDEERKARAFDRAMAGANQNGGFGGGGVI